MTKPRPVLTPQQRIEADQLRAKIRTLKAAGLTTSATALRRKLRALLGGYDNG